MTLVQAIKPVFVDNKFRKVGDTFDYDGPMPPKGTDSPFVAVEDLPPPEIEAAKKKGKKGGIYAPAPTWSTEGHPDNPANKIEG